MRLQYIPSYHGHLRNPWLYGPASNTSLLDLHLVCRAFHELLKSVISFHCFVREKNAPIPLRTKAFYIASDNKRRYFKRLLAEPETCRQLVTLELPFDTGYPDNKHRPLFCILYQNRHLFHRVRNLSLDLLPHMFTDFRAQRFWEHLNQTFSHLICLSLRGRLISEDEDGTVVVFEGLEILDVDESKPGHKVHFPALRHVSCGTIEPLSEKMQNFSWLCLESLLVRKADRLHWQMDWTALPRLQFLGVLSTRVDIIEAFPPEHPLEHLHLTISVGGGSFSEAIERAKS